MSPKYQQYSLETQQEIVELISSINLNPNEIIYRENRKKLHLELFDSKYSPIIKDGFLHKLTQDQHLYDELASLLHITTKHLFVLMNTMDMFFDIRKSKHHLYNKKDRDIFTAKYEVGSMIHELATQFESYKYKISQDYTKPLIGYYSHLN